MAGKWTDTMIAKLAPRSTPYGDPAQPCLELLVRERKAGPPSRTWYLRLRFRTEPVHCPIGRYPEMSLAEAREQVRRDRELAAQGIDPRRARARRRERPPLAPPSANARAGDKHSIEHLVAEFTERYLRPTRKRPEYAEAILAKDVLPEWKGRDARTIEPHEVIELLDKIIERGSRVMANRTAALLSQLFRFGIHRRIVKSSPVQLLYRPGGKEKPRERTLTDAELAAYLTDPKACTRFERLAHVITILLLTGQRRGELALARWDEIDFGAKTWTIPDDNAKGGRGHVVPLTDCAVQEFEALHRLAGKSVWVLPANGGEHHIDPKQLTRGVSKCLDRFKKCGIAPFTLHDLRRTCRTGLARLKVEPHVAERVLNHVQPGIVGVYDRFAYLEEKRAALEKWGTHLNGIQGAK